MYVEIASRILICRGIYSILSQLHKGRPNSDPNTPVFFSPNSCEIDLEDCLDVGVIAISQEMVLHKDCIGSVPSFLPPKKHQDSSQQCGNRPGCHCRQDVFHISKPRSNIPNPPNKDGDQGVDVT